jgi:hypothetical protein
VQTQSSNQVRSPLESPLIRFLISLGLGLLLVGVVVEVARWISSQRATAMYAKLATYLAKQADDAKKKAGDLRQQASKASSPELAQEKIRAAEDLENESKEYSAKASRALEQSKLGFRWQFW